MKNRILTLTTCVFCLAPQGFAQHVSVQEQTETLKTYKFSDPNPVATPSNLFYPYFRFDGFTAKGENREWKTVELENDYIKVTLFPEVGGKIWGAVDKSTGKDFIYKNGVAKFRDIAMRGPWTSGGIEFNFGIIGHAPTSSTPVDYLVRQKDDGSVSCYLFSYEWLTRTAWTVEVNLPKDKAYFTTHTTWYNQSDVDQPYYQWMNAGYRVGQKAEFCYPGDHLIGHGGEVSSFPVDENNRNIGWYDSNNFGNSKSYHVLGYYNDYYGIYWHGEDFGSIHHSNFDEKLGMKIFLWGQSREGGIWEDLLTDQNGQYIELQSGRMFNQPASNSTYTPYKHHSFAPQMTDAWTEYWYPVKGIKGVSKASTIGALHVMREADGLKLAFSPLEKLSTDLKIYKDQQLVETLSLTANVMEPVTLTSLKGKDIPEGHLKVVIGDNLLIYSDNPENFDLKRPMTLPEDFNWNSAFGLYTQGEQWLNQKVWDKAESYLKKSLEQDANFSPALVRLSSLYYREGRYQEMIPLLERALGLNTYDGEANYLYGLANRMLGNATEAKAAFAIATFSASVRTAAYEQLGEMYACDRNWTKAEQYAKKSLTYNAMNLHARQLLTMIYRKTGRTELAKEQISQVLDQLPLYHGLRFEEAWLSGNHTPEQLASFASQIRNELPAETYLELAEWYERTGCEEEAIALLTCAGNHPIALYQKAWLQNRQGAAQEARETLELANAQSPDYIFPFRPETLKYLDWAESQSANWKINYYQGLIYWTNQQKDKAILKMNLCDNAGYAPLYLSRAQLKEGEARLADLMKAEQTDPSWRVGMALLNYYTAESNWDKVVETGKKYIRKYPDNYYIGLKYANGLCETRQYGSCISLLSKMQVLPNEGSYAGRAVYRAANLYQAMDQFSKRRYDAALKSIKASEEWPENLGVGKPYDDQIDKRLEDYLEAKVYEKKGETAKAQTLLDKVSSHPTSTRNFESAHLLTALALRDTGKQAEADKLVASWKKDFPESKPAQWCAAVYHGNMDQARELLSSRYASNETTPWETGYRDTNFDLIARLFSEVPR